VEESNSKVGWLAAVGLLLVVFTGLCLMRPEGCLWWSDDREEPAIESSDNVIATPRETQPTPTAPPPYVVTGEDPLAERAGAGLNLVTSDARRDLLALDRLLYAWRSNAQGLGNPFGTNREITATLTGRNQLNLVALPPDHPAINARGELCDRWGTPYFFHQISGTRMELISAGPDRQRGTPDDIVLTPMAAEAELP
jgi:hypothetical protein